MDAPSRSWCSVEVRQPGAAMALRRAEENVRYFKPSNLGSGKVVGLALPSPPETAGKAPDNDIRKNCQNNCYNYSLQRVDPARNYELVDYVQHTHAMMNSFPTSSTSPTGLFGLPVEENVPEIWRPSCRLSLKPATDR